MAWVIILQVLLLIFVVHSQVSEEFCVTHGGRELCFWSNTTNVQQSEAVDICRKHGGYIYMPTVNQTLWEDIVSAGSLKGRSEGKIWEYWIGINDVEEEGTWKTTSGGTPPFLPHIEKNNDERDCLVISSQLNDTVFAKDCIKPDPSVGVLCQDHPDKCEVAGIDIIIDVGTMNRSNQDLLDQFRKHILHHLDTSNMEYSTIMVTNRTDANIARASESVATIVDSFVSVVNQRKPKGPDEKTVTFIITDSSDELKSQIVLKQASSACNISNLVVVAIGISNITKKQELARMLNGQLSRIIFVDDYPGLDNKVYETIQVMCAQDFTCHSSTLPASMKKSGLLNYANSYIGPAVNLLKKEKIAEVLPRQQLDVLTIADIDKVSKTLFVRLPDSKKLALTRQTLASLAFSKVEEEIENNFQTKGCGFVSSINVSILMEPGHVSLDLALDMCECSEHGSENITAKMDVLCGIIFTNIKTLQELLDIQDKLCPLCFAYIMTNRPTWLKDIIAHEDMKNSACDKIGQSFQVPTSVLTQWAQICTSAAKVGDRPSLMLHGPSPPSVADLAVCKDVFCHRLCHLTAAEIDIICQTLNQHQGEYIGCLAYLDDNISQWVGTPPVLDSQDIPGSCSLRSKVIKRAREAQLRWNHRRRLVGCSGITDDIKHGIVPSDVLSVEEIEEDLGNDTYNCVKKNHLGVYHWDQDQAMAIFNHLRHDRSFNKIGSNVEVLGYIGVGFTPTDLGNMAGLSNTVYETFGEAYGWSPEQLHTLAQRYLHDNHIDISEPYKLQYYDLVRLNHLICGFSVEFVKGLTLGAIVDSTPVLGKMQRCEIGVLEVLARQLIVYYGPVIHWPEDHFSEFGIILAGVSGDNLRDVGRALSDYVTVPFVNHIRPTEFWKLTPEQTSLFGYDVSLALSKRGLCAWLTDRHKQGYLEHLCAGAGTVTPFYMCALILLALTVTGRLWWM